LSVTATPSAAATGRGAPKEEALFRPLGGFRPGLLLGSLVTGLLTGVLFFSWGYQIRNDIGVAGINRPVFWGFYITNFVFWIGISHAGTLISAILRVTAAEWRRPVTRCAEAITVFALSIGGLFPLIHLGRPWLFWFMVPLPNSRGLWPNFRSPLVWDMMAITTYLTGSILYLLLPMIPDFAILRDRAVVESPGSVRTRVYKLLAFGWRGTPQQWHSLEAGIRAMAVIIIPVAVSVHTIVSWDFSMTLQPMWHSTIFGPYFVVGAIYSGIAVLMVAMYVLRRGLGLQEYLTDKVFNNLGLMFVAFAVIWGYFTFAEHLTVWYGSEPTEMTVFWQRVSGAYGWIFWLMIVVNVVIPLGVLSFPWGRRPLATAVVGLGVLLGMWIERFLIVVGTLRFPRLDFTPGAYAPAPVELGVLVGSFGLFALLYFVFVQVAPIISLWEVREGDHVASGGSRRAQPSAEPGHRTSELAPEGA
jgi:Ni/Fe-hydrogenase subunit HybB-like protein